AWHAGHFDSVHVPYSDFGDRFADLLGDAASRPGRTLIVTSGGVIGMSLARHLGLGPDGYARMMLPVRNTSVHQFRVFAGQTYIAGYNATPHLDSADRIHARTTI
ncbi:MAG: histidine phosphatase family protein, partial [Planktomarina sp.]